MGRQVDPTKRPASRKPAGPAAQSLVALLLLSTATGCATYDHDRPRTSFSKPRAQAPRSAFYVVARGDTLGSIAREMGVSKDAILEINSLDDPDALRPGQRILIPRGNSRSRGASRAVASRDLDAPAPKRTRQPKREIRDLDAPADEIDPRLAGARYYSFDGPKSKPGDVRVAYDPDDGVDLDAAYEPAPRVHKPFQVSRSAGNFVWPVRGRVISEFGGDETGQRNDGINIVADAGTPVKAAESGVVVYAGNELSSYGKLLLIRHPSGYVTAYAHNDKLIVAKNDIVKRGQKIALVGSTGKVDRPQLHFEIRRGDKPVDPEAYLSSATASR
jgi:murein DD-endopeptidase MepM/ murein hydrolase activator NlpD